MTDEDKKKKEEEAKKKSKLQPCSENTLITNKGQVREGVGVTKKAKILME